MVCVGIYNRKLFGFKKRDPAIYNNVEETERNDAKWNKPHTENKTTRAHFWVESKKAKFIEAERE